MSPPRLFLADLADDGYSYKVDCPYAVTRTDAPPATVAEMGHDALFRVTLFRHGLECGACDLAEAFAQVGEVPESAEECRHLEVQRKQAAMRARRN